MHNASTGPGSRSLIQGWEGGKIAPAALCTLGAIQLAKALSPADTRPWAPEEPQERESSRSKGGSRESKAACCHHLHFRALPHPHRIASSPSPSSSSSSSCFCSLSSEEDRISLHLPLGFLFIWCLPS